jgi:hypothetical protein
MRRREVKRRLARSVASLNSYCQEPAIKQVTSWPSGDFLESVREMLEVLAPQITSHGKRFAGSMGACRRFGLPCALITLRTVRSLGLSQPHTRRLGRARPLIRWLVRIRYPRVTELAAVNRAAASAIKRQTRLDQDARLEKERETARLRKQRERLKKFDKKP